ncbi:serine hydrolase [Paenibacillus larvae]|nr:serine hydrolase [Paenibacillus larvae]MCY9526581.1 serine hydrolase [Paenibacillus larvae]
MYTMLGFLIESITDTSWEEWTQKRILAPLGMQNTYLTLEEVKQTENYALPYVKVDGQNTEIPFSTDVAGTAGATSCHLLWNNRSQLPCPLRTIPESMSTLHTKK